MNINKKLLEDYLLTKRGKCSVTECYQKEYLVFAKYFEEDGTEVTDLTISLLDLISFVYSKI